MIPKKKLQGTVFFDIETTTRYKTFEEYTLAEPYNAKDFIYRASMKYPNLTPDVAYKQYGMLYPEHGQVVSIAWKILVDKELQGEIIGFKDWREYETTEDKRRADRKMLFEFNRVLETIFPDGDGCLGGYRIKYYDIPFLYKRMLLNGIFPHQSLITVDKKPWDIKHLDLYDYWNVGVNGMSGFGTICDLMGVQNPKDDEIDGRQVCFRFWDDQNTPIINEYCMRDVESSVRLAWKLTDQKLMKDYEETHRWWAELEEKKNNDDESNTTEEKNEECND
jgi:hypothetical protein